MKVLILLMLALAAVTSCSPLIKEWESWKQLYKKTYANREEEFRRMSIWEVNNKYIEEHNAKSTGFTLKVNEFSDMSGGEFTHIYNGFHMDMANNRGNATKIYAPKKGIQIPSSYDWREHNYVTPVKNQGQCGSCWTFATTGALEGQHYKATGYLISLSEQQLVDCAKSAYGEHGCQGGNPDMAFRYISAYGIQSEASYPYTAEDGDCLYSSNKVVATCKGYVDIPQGYESILLSACYENGPISVAIDASHEDFQHYSGGVYSNSLCSSTKLDHGVLVVGFGNYNGQDYWLVKNSWGASWGISGYFMMARNANNMCGIATMASYPTV